MPIVNKRIYISYTGGTIGMQETPQGYAPKKGYLEERLKGIVKGYENMVGQYYVNEYSKLLDSSNIGLDSWNKIAEDIANVYDKYDAFIVITGTDTMAYIASALSFMMEGLNKPIIFTGSQLALVNLRNDGQNNLINSLLVASRYTIPEVVIVFDNLILRGNRSVKVNANSVRAFASPNFPPLGASGADISLDKALWLPAGNGLRVVKMNTNKKVVLVKLFPGLNAQFMSNILSDPLIEGVILQTFGIGDAPTEKDFLNVLHNANMRGVIIINCTQCIMGRVDQTDYATGTGLQNAGVLSGYDMTGEAALGKLSYLLSAYANKETVKQLMGQNLRGELSIKPAQYQQTGTFI